MDIKEIQNLIKFVAKSGASEVSLEMDDVKITIKTGDDKAAVGESTTIVQQIPPVVAQTVPAAAPVAAPAVTPTVEAPATEAAKSEDSDHYITVKSPLSEHFIENLLQINLYLLRWDNKLLRAMFFVLLKR